MINYIWYVLGYPEEDEEVKPSDRQVRLRHELMKQIKLSKIKLKSADKDKYVEFDTRFIKKTKKKKKKSDAKIPMV